MKYMRANDVEMSVEMRYSRIQTAERAFEIGFCIRSTLNPGYVMAVREALKMSGKDIGAAIRRRDAKTAAKMMRSAVNIKRSYLDAVNQSIYTNERTLYRDGQSYGVLYMDEARYNRYE